MTSPAEPETTTATTGRSEVAPGVRDASAPDKTDRILEVWARELPSLDLETEGIVERIQVLQRRLERAFNDTLAGFELTYGEFKLLMLLRYEGRPYRSSPGVLADRLGLSSGAMTNRLDRMEARSLVRRLPDPDDRRGIQVELTDEGRELWERAVDAQAAKEQLVASALGDSEKRELNALLRRLVHAFDSVGPTASAARAGEKGA